MEQIESILIENTSIDDEPEKKYEIPPDRLKIGEIFQLLDGNHALSCIQCSQEFQYFTEFTLHIEEHYLRYELPRLQRIKAEATTSTGRNVTTASIAEPEVVIKSEPASVQQMSVSNDDSDCDINNDDNDFHGDSDGSEVITDVVTSNKVVEDDKKGVICDQPSTAQGKINVTSQNITANDNNWNFNQNTTTNTSWNTPGNFNNDESEDDDNLFNGVPFELNFGGDPEPSYIEGSDYKMIDDKSFQCLICGRVLKKRNEMKDHLLIHSTKKNFYCPMCTRTFANIKYVVKHTFRFHKQKMTIGELGELQAQLRAKHVANEVATKSTAKVERTPNVDLFNCLYCNKTFAKTRYCQTHIRYIHNKVATVEEIKNITDLIASGKHMPAFTEVSCVRKVEDPKQFECYDCHKPLRSIISLKKHLKMHTGVKFKCGVTDCGKIFGGRQYLRDHVIVVHNIDIKEVKQYIVQEHLNPSQVITHKCSDCKKTFSNEYKFQGHVCIKVTPNVGTLACQECGLQYGSRYALRRHIRISHNPNGKVPENHKCEHCDKSFPFRGYLLKHMRRMHSAMQPSNFICDICGMNLNSRGHFTKHVASHSIVKLKCDYCNKTITEQGMKKHVQKHLKKMMEAQQASDP